MRLALGAALLTLIAACTGTDDVTASVVSTANTIGVGEQRILVELRDRDGDPQEAGTSPVATLRDENGSPLGVSAGTLVWVVPGEHPMYAFVVEVPEPETYQLTIDIGDAEVGPAGFTAVGQPIQVEVGELAPPLDGEGLSGAGLVVFASADRCPSGSCRPMIAQIESALEDAPGLDLRVVEVFTDPDAGSDEELELSTSVRAWGLPSQPWLYAIDDTGVVAAVFEGAVADEELAAAISLIEG
jgi:hypothetical protein